MFENEITYKLTHTWELRKLEDIAQFSKGNGYSKADLTNSGTPIILYGRLYTKYETTISRIDTFAVPKQGSVYSKGGEVIIPSSGETAEDIVRAATVEKAGVILGGDLNIVSPNKDTNSTFLALSISNGDSQKELSKKAQGKSVVHIHNEEIKRLGVPFPEKNEQDKIVSYFSNIDNFITLHQRKYDCLVKLKKSMLQKMFPKNGEKIPEIRFPGFTDAWEQRKLGDCFTERSERSKEGLLIAVTINSGVIKASDLNRKDNSSQDKSNYKVVRKNDIAYNSMRMWQGASGYSLYDGILSPAYTVVIPNKNTDSEFFSYMFKKIELIHLFQSHSQGLTSDTWNLKFPTFSSIEVTCPIEEEQKSIASFLRKLDNLITLHQRKLESLKKLKKGMLQQMFV